MLNSIFSNRIELLVEQYVNRLTEGDEIDRSSFIADHPAVALELARALSLHPEVSNLERLRLHTFTSLDETDFSVATAPRSIFRPDVEAAVHVGTMVDDYEIQSVIGWGSMGRVCKAWHEPTQTIVALKTLPPGIDTNFIRLARMDREGKTQSQLRHPNIVQVIDCGTVDGVPYLVMEYVEGARTLRDLLNDRGTLSEKQAAEIAMSIAEALDYIHRRGIIHRDVKPENVIMVGDTPKLNDFGLAFIDSEGSSRLTSKGDILGTLCYMPTEQLGEEIEEDRYEPRPYYDIYSLGVTLYEMLVGKVPFAAETPGKLIRQIVTTDPIPPRAQGVKVSLIIESICVKCLEKSSRKRYKNALELRTDLQSFIDDEPVDLEPVNWRKRRWRRNINYWCANVATGYGVVTTQWQGFLRRFNYAAQVQQLRELGGSQPITGPDYAPFFLLRALDHEDYVVRKAAVVALSRHDNHAVRDRLADFARTCDMREKLHLAQAMINAPLSVAVPVCEVVLKDKSDYILLAAVKLAERTNDRRFEPVLSELSVNENRTVRLFAIRALLKMLEDDYDNFIESFLGSAPLESRLDLLNLFLHAKFPPSIEPLIDLIERTESVEEKQLIEKVLGFYTDQNFGENYRKWRFWWSRFRGEWKARRCLAITRAPLLSLFESGDIIWAVNHRELPRFTEIMEIGQGHFDLIRKGKLMSVATRLEKEISHLFYIGTIKGLPVGNNSLVPKTLVALKRAEQSTL